MSQLRRVKQKLLKDICKPSDNPNEGWIIFFDDDKGVRHYFEKMYLIGRPRFNTKKFSMFDNILDCHKYLEQVEEALKLYGLPGFKGKIKLMAAQATISNN